LSDVLAGGVDTKKLMTGFERLFGRSQPYNTYSGYQVGPPQQGQYQPYDYSGYQVGPPLEGQYQPYDYSSF
jgi:hypothetical protein